MSESELKVQIPWLTWRRLIKELRRRGKGRQESGAFLLGKKSPTVRAIAYYDDLDPGCLESGAVEFHGRGMSALGKLCEQQGLRVLADVHTHPSRDTRQSRIDKRNPMIPVSGHIGLIVPSYGNSSIWTLKGVGVHVYEGGVNWTSYDGSDPEAPVGLVIKGR